MHQDVGIGLLRCTVLSPGRACRDAVPPAAHACRALSDVDHENAVIVEVGLDQERAGSGPSDLAVTPDHHPNRALVGVVGAWPAARCSSVCRSVLGQPQAR